MSRSSRSLKVAPECLPRVRQALRLHGFPSQKALSIEMGISRSTITSFFTGKAIDYLNFVEISSRLRLDWQAIAYIPEAGSPPPPSPEQQTGVDWQQVSRAMLTAQNQRRLTTNPLTAGDGVTFELDEIHIPWRLAERKRRDRRRGDISPERGSRIYEPEASDEIIKTYQQDEFFEQVLCLERSQRIAIIGEPGAGKTTLLQKIASWVVDELKDVAIWIFLADLQQGQTIEDYILQTWLKQALPHIRKLSPEVVPSLLEVSKTLQEALADEFYQGRVWLLLDAVDEMVMGRQNLAPLQWIANQLTGWVDDAKVVLTCRLNVWDAGKNALETFDAYRNLDFSYGDAQTPDRVGQFIRRWFKSNPELAFRLRAELEKPGRERIKDAVKNPLRLALLCRTWGLGKGELPNTKAGLYQQFIEAFYEWKQEKFPTTANQRQALNRSLGELALRAISSEKTKFRLREHFVCSVLGEPDEELFQLALQLGWLNQVGVAAEAENRGERVYAFYHPTFQEYLAARAIDDWHYFLNHIPHNPAQGTYRIFEPSWKELILLWLGQEDVPHAQKEDFIKALVEFQDGCKDFYGDRAYLLAATGIAEFSDYSRTEEIVAKLVQWGFGYFDIERHKWMVFLSPLDREARNTLLETERNQAIAALVQLIESTEGKDILWLAAENLDKIDSGNETAIKALVQLIESTQDESTRRRAAHSLGQIAPGNPIAIATLVQLIELTQDASIRRQAAYSLGQIAPGNPIAIAALVQLIESTQDAAIRRQAAYSLGQIGIGNQTAITALVQLIESTQDEFTCRQAAYCLGQISTGNPIAIAALVQLIESTPNKFTCRRAAHSLGQIDPANPIAITALVQLIESTQDESIYSLAAYSLGQIDPGNPIALVASVQLIESAKDEYNCWLAAHSLGQIDPDNQTVFAALVQLINSCQDEYTRQLAAHSLGRIDPGNELAIAALVQLIESTEDESFRRKAADSLIKILQDEQLAGIVIALKDYLSDESYEKDRERCRECYKLIYHCAQNLNYPAFYQAWYNQQLQPIY